MSKNKFGLVYKNAIEDNVPGKVNLKTIYYKNFFGLTIAANLYTPANFDSKKKYPAIVVAHPNGGVKEQVAGLFAQGLAENGYVTVAYDAAYQGASEGNPRQTDNPAFRVEDINASVDYLNKLDFVDDNRIGITGICGGGGYTIQAAKTDKRLRAVATISAFNSGRVRRNGFKDADKEGIQKRLSDVSKAREKYAKTGEVDYIGNLLTERHHFSKEELEQIPAGLYRDGVEYYGDTHYHPNSQSRYTTMSLMNLMAWDAEDQADLINQPLLMMVGDVSDTRYMTEGIFNKATGTNDKKLVLIKGASHIETYWKEPYVTEELNNLFSFFNEKLA